MHVLKSTLVSAPIFLLVLSSLISITMAIDVLLPPSNYAIIAEPPKEVNQNLLPALSGCVILIDFYFVTRVHMLCAQNVFYTCLKLGSNYTSYGGFALYLVCLKNGFPILI